MASPGEAPVDAAALMAGGVIRKTGDGIKILAKGTIEKALTVRVNTVSEATKAKIKAAGGEVEVIESRGQRIDRRTEKHTEDSGATESASF